MKSNEELQNDVLQAISWEPLLRPAAIRVEATAGVVKLSGAVASYAIKLEAEQSAKHVVGVKELINTIEVKLLNDEEKSDELLEKEVSNILKLCSVIPTNSIKSAVDRGWVRLEGQIQWNHQREAAKDAVSKIMGVKGVISNLKIKTHVGDTLEKKAIEYALERHSSLDEKKIQVYVTGNNVILRGTVKSMTQKDEAGRLAWNAPGVWSIDNELEVEHWG